MHITRKYWLYGLKQSIIMTYFQITSIQCVHSRPNSIGKALRACFEPKNSLECEKLSYYTI